MRPPSYYNSIVKSNNTSGGHSYASLDYDSAPRTSSQQLRSSFSSPSSSSYVSRSHLPFVPQSTLVAHCFTGVGSSTRPYGGQASGAGSSYRSGSGSSSYISSSTSLSSAYSSNSSNSSATKRAYSSSNYSSTTPSSALLRPSYLSPSSLTSSTTTSRYRPPTTTTASSYYKPIRLRERPLLTQISRQIGSPTPSAETAATSARRAEPKTIHSNSSDPNAALDAGKTSENTETRQAERKASADWSSDIGRNISRNKYLIKFREIDKQARSSSPPDIEATIQLPAPEPPLKPVDCLLQQNEPPPEPKTAEPVVVVAAAAVQEKVASSKESEKTDKVVAACPEVEKKSGDKKKPKPEEMRLAVDEEQPVKKAPLKKEKKNVKLRLRPVGTLAAKAAEVEASTTTTIIDKKLDRGEVVALDNKVTSQQLPSDQPKHEKAEEKRPAKSKEKEDKENRVEKEGEVLTPKKDRAATGKPSQQSPDVTTTATAKVKTRKRTKKEADDSQKTDSKIKPSSKGAASERAGLEPEAKSKPPPPPPSRQEQVEVAATIASPVSSPKKAPSRIRFREYNYDDFNFLTVLGHGGWGFVILAELKEHDACFAVKCIKKITIVEDDDYDSIMIERKVLALGNIHPFICKLFCTFETEGYLFFVMEYCPGGDLMFHVQHEGKFTESRCRFYASEIICAIRFLHNRHIIYRDLKLDNILLDARGHIRLVDFGMCQCRTYREEMLPSNFCGTPEYISPEIIKGVPYNHSVDWWSFGVLLYEMAVGKMPFRGNDENELLWNVCYEQIHYPMFLSKELTSLLKLLLEREPSLRMGMATCKAGDIYDQPYFRGVDWRAVEEMRVEPPFTPEVKSNRDVSNFDSDFTESACELSPVDEGTLAKIDQKQFQQFPYTNPDIFIFDTATRTT